MAIKPTVDPVFDSGLVNVTATTVGHQTSGYAVNEVPTAQEFNYWMNLVYLWILWFKVNISTIVRNGFPPIISNSMSAPAIGGGPFFYVAGGAASQAVMFDCNALQGYKLTSITLPIAASSAANGNMVVTLYQYFLPGAAGVSAIALHTRTFLSGALPTVLTDQTLNYAAAGVLSGQTVTVVAAGGTYTRSAGSYLTDGFFVGQSVTWAGFVNGGNNVTKTITALTATVMTVSTTGLVNETGAAGAASLNSNCPTVDNTFIYLLGYQSTAGSGVSNSFGAPRITMVPQ